VALITGFARKFTYISAAGFSLLIWSIAEGFGGPYTSAGMHAATLTFTAAAPGTYRYLCPVPGHARNGMTGLFTVTTTN
jgi:plastocyanin